MPRLISLFLVIACCSTPGAQEPWLPVASFQEDDSDGSDEEFGWSVSISGNQMAVGARSWNNSTSDYGRVFIYALDAQGQWSLYATLNNPQPTNYDYFGHSVSLSGDWLAVGAPYADINGNVYVGKTHIYTRNAGGQWNLATTLSEDLGGSGTYFGAAVSMSGDRLAVLSWSGQIASCPGCIEGTIHIYQRDSQGTWILSESFPNPSSTSGLGTAALTLSGDTLVVGHRYEYVGGLPDTGAAFIYECDPSGQWSHTATKYRPGILQGSDYFGWSVSVSGDLLAVSSIDNSLNPSWSGTAHLYQRSATGQWNHLTSIPNPDPQDNDQFGSSLALSGHRLAVGAENDNSGSGGAYIYAQDSQGNWSLVSSLVNPGPQPTSGSDFGHSVSLSGGLLAVGGHTTDSYSGRAWIFHSPNDCNGNGLPDINDIMAGLSDDCNGNEIPDDCEISSSPAGFDLDCNSNGILDTCDIAAGVSLDCDGDEIPDDCLIATYIARGDVLAPLAAATALTQLFEGVPPASADVVITIDALGDLGALTEEIDIQLNGTSIGTVYTFTGAECPANSPTELIILDANTFNALTPTGTAQFTLTPSALVDAALCADSFITIELEYSGVVAHDCNGNSIPDICDLIAGTSSDCNGNAIPDECDIAAGTSTDADASTIPDECEYTPFVRGDTNTDGSIELADVIYLLDDLFGDGAPVPCSNALDINNDDTRDISDGVYLLTYLFNNGPNPQNPFPTCGPDPTEDLLGCESFGVCP